MNKKFIRGFTLLEVLLALMIFTLISLTVYQSIMVTSKGSVIVNKKLKQMNRLQRVFDILEQDISHAIIYSDSQDNNILNSGVKIGKSLLDSDDFGILFLCDISTNTNYYSRSQTLGYRLRNNSLEKLSYGINKKQPKISKVLDGVTVFHIQVYHKNRWLKEWNESAYLPEGVELVISLENIGVVRKVFILLNYTI
ncbi:type II secretion system minor pseudopilin GspJ [Yersinia canariae]|uniref:type II secretion system minor pseudopilin GspJ n=1 Tax=Yersinia canariae TaxID=2607663 RepID=UPI0011A17B0A|nr:type II secretion system minor pseudopilin GspJ [Yersinia canariae]